MRVPSIARKCYEQKSDCTLVVIKMFHFSRFVLDFIQGIPKGFNLACLSYEVETFFNTNIGSFKYRYILTQNKFNRVFIDIYKKHL
jgi:hypothetical protein